MVNYDCQESVVYKNRHTCKCGNTQALVVDCLSETELGVGEQSTLYICPKCDPLNWFCFAYSALYESDDTDFWLERLKAHEHLFFRALAELEMKVASYEH